MKRLLLLLVLLTVAGCGTMTLPAVDWCYKMDFNTGDYGASIYRGRWTNGLGFTPDDDGTFNIQYIHTSDVIPDAVIFGLIRADSNQIPIDVTIEQGSVFGMDTGAITTTVPADVNIAQPILRQQGAGSDYIFIRGHASRTIVLVNMQVRGFGSNPFPSSNCSTDAVTPQQEQNKIQLPNIGEIISNADQQLADAGNTLTNPDGSPLLPSQTGAVLFGYAKWLTSPAAAEELLGPFAPVASHVGIFLLMDVTLVGLYFIIYAAIYIVRWAIWLFKLLLQIIQTIASAANGAIGWLLAFIGL